MIQPKKEFMQAAIREALKAREKGDYSIGAIIVRDDKIIVGSGNRIKLDEDPTSHAEVVAIRRAAKKFGTRKLKECVLYTTHEPCPMCTTATIWARMKGIVYGAKMEDMKEYGEKHNNDKWKWLIINIPAATVIKKANSKMFLIKEFMRQECKKLFHN